MPLTIAARCLIREADECSPHPGSCGACHRAAIELRLRDRPRLASPLLLLALFSAAVLVA